jgi:HK97 gp10 family phage protein
MTDTSADDIRKLVNDLRKIGDGVGRNLGKEFKKAAGPVAAQAKTNASWSTRIPGAITVGVSSSRRYPGAQIKVSKTKAPHARLYEFGSGRRKQSFRHPVYKVKGREAPWVEQATRPFIRPAIRAKGGEFIKAADRAVDETARAHGFR